MKTARFLYFLQEVAIVVIGVLIAVSIGNYKEKVDNERYLKKTFSAIQNEIELNQKDIDTVLVRHVELYENLENELDENGRSLGEFLSNSGGFQIASLRNVSLRFFISNKAELLEFSLINQLLDIELKTELLSEKINRLADFAYDRFHDSSAETKIKFGYMLGDVIDEEQGLIASYSDFIEKNEAYLNTTE